MSPGEAVEAGDGVRADVVPSAKLACLPLPPPVPCRSAPESARSCPWAPLGHVLPRGCWTSWWGEGERSHLGGGVQPSPQLFCHATASRERPLLRRWPDGRSGLPSLLGFSRLSA